MDTFNLHPLDYVLFFGVLCISAGIGLVFAFIGGRQMTTKEYLTGDRQLSLIPASLSIVVTYMSAISMLGDPAESYLYGAAYLWMTMASIIGAILANVLFVPIFYPLQLTSINKYIEMRYQSVATKVLATICGVLQCLSYTGVVIYAPATAISLLTGFPTWSVVLTFAAVSITYTALGGLKAVIWTDTFQAAVMLAGLTTILITSTVGSGGIEGVFNYNKEGQRLHIFNVSPDVTERITIWNMLIGQSFNYAMIYGTSQAAVVRYSGLKSISTARWSVLVVLVGNLFISQIPILAGLGLYAYFAHQGCDPVNGGLIESANQLVPYYVMQVLNYPGVPGLFTAALSAGALSTVSSVLNAACALTWDDLFQPKLPHIAQWKATLICKCLVLMYGVVAVLVSFVTMGLGGTVLQASLSLNGALIVPVFGMILVGASCPWVNSIGAIVGSFASSGILLWIMMGSYTLKKFTTDTLPTITNMCNISVGWKNDTWVKSTSLHTTASLTSLGIVANETSVESNINERSVLEYIYGTSFFWYPVLGCTIMFVVASLVSLCTGCTRNYMINSQLLLPCVRRYKNKVQKTDLLLSRLGEDVNGDKDQRFLGK